MNNELKQLLILSEVANKLFINAIEMLDANPNNFILNISLQSSDGEKAITSELKNLGDLIDRLNNAIEKLAPKIQSGEFILVPREPKNNIISLMQDVFTGVYIEGKSTGYEAIQCAYKAMIESVEKDSE